MLSPDAIPDPDSPLTREEIQSLTTAVHQLSPTDRDWVLRIIRNSSLMEAGDEDDIDLEVYRLAPRIQRDLLQRFVVPSLHDN